MNRSPNPKVCAQLVCFVLASALPVAALTQQQPAATLTSQSEREFDIPAQPLSAALRAFAELTDLQLVYSSSLVAGARSTPLKGRFSASDGLQRLLSGTGLTFRFGSGNAIVIEKQNTSGARVLGAVRVEGADGGRSAVNGINGSRDVTATEGTGSYTSGALTVGSKTPQSIKDTTQSVSVITQQRIEEQNIIDFNQVMNQATGVTLVHGSLNQTGSNLDYNFYSRGFAMTSLQVDGGAPMTRSFAGNEGFFPQIDLSQYDHVEILRGAAGLFNGYGDPSGTVNLVRKRPLDHARVSVEVQAGSWSTYRAVLDATAPLGFDGALRGRTVMTYQDNEHFYDVARDNKTLFYGILEYDLTSATLLTSGVSHARQDSVPWLFGLPRYQNGDDLNLPRHTCLCFSWNSQSFDTTEIFASVAQNVGERWQIRFSATRNEQTSERKDGYSLGTVNPLTGAGPTLTGDMTAFSASQLATELTVSGAFDVLGQQQRMVAGVTYSDQDGSGRTSYAALISAPYVAFPDAPAGIPGIDVFHFDPRNPLYTEPRDALPSTRYRELGQVQSGAYLNLNLTAFDRLHLATGVRYSKYEYQFAYDQFCTFIPPSGKDPCVGKKIGDIYSSLSKSYATHDVSWPPAVSLSFDVAPSVAVYAGYTDIYESQANLYDADLQPIDPITGSNIETGIKWQARDGRLNASLAAYRVEKENYGLQDATRLVVAVDPSTGRNANYYVANDGQRFANGVVDPQHSCCYISNPSRGLLSRGVDAELAGELLPRWQFFLGYTWNKNEQKGAYFGSDPLTGDGTPVVSQQPEHLLKLWTSYRFDGSSWLRRLMVGIGANAQSRSFRKGSACVEMLPPNAQGVSACAPNKTVPYAYTLDPYAVWSARLDYSLNERWNVALNAQNITDKRYYQTMGDSRSGNWYGDPASYTLTVKAKW